MPGKRRLQPPEWHNTFLHVPRTQPCPSSLFSLGTTYFFKVSGLREQRCMSPSKTGCSISFRDRISNVQVYIAKFCKAKCRKKLPALFLVIEGLFPSVILSSPSFPKNLKHKILPNRSTLVTSSYLVDYLGSFT